MAKNKNGYTKAQQRKVDAIKRAGGTVPVGMFGSALPREQVAERMAHLRSGAAGAHVSSNLRRGTTAGRTNRVGSRSAQRNAAVRDWA